MLRYIVSLVVVGVTNCSVKYPKRLREEETSSSSSSSSSSSPAFSFSDEDEYDDLFLGEDRACDDSIFTGTGEARGYLPY